MSASAKSVGTALGVASVAVAALTAGTVALIRQTTEYGKEVKLASQLSGIAADELQSMAFATSTVSIGIEKLGDISKDTRERIGQFTSESKGGFADFAQVMGLTTIEALALSEEFTALSGPEVLQEMVSRMEKAELSTQEMSFALEGMASDTTNLIPLLLDGGRAMGDLRNAMDGVTVPLTNEDLQKLADLDIALNTAAESAKSLANQTLVNLSDWFINAANAASFFFASLNEGTRADLLTNLLPITEEIAEIENNLSRASGAEETRLQSMLDKLIVERKAISDALAALDATPVKPEIQKTEPSGGGVSPTGGPTADEIAKRKQAVIDSFKTEHELLAEKYKSDQELFAENKEVLLQLEARYKEDLAELNSDNSLDFIRNRYKSEEDLLQEKFDRELEMIGEDEELKKERKAQFLNDMAALEQEALDKEVEAKKKADAKISKAKDKEKSTEDKLKAQSAKRDEQMAGDAMKLAALVFEDNKAISAGIALVNTAQGVTKALSIQNYAGAAITAAMGAAQISSILSASKGGGSTVSGGSGSAPAQEAFEPETTSLELSDSTASGSQTLNVTVPSGDELGIALANWMKQAEIEGRI
jgi:hypothetical protein